MTWKAGVAGGLLCIMLPVSIFGDVKRTRIIGRNSGSITLDDGRVIRVSGFADKLNESPPLPGVTIEAMTGDSVTIDFWNVAQGDPHDVQIAGITVRKENEPHEL